MFFNAAKDWKQFLTLDDENKLNEILRTTSRYRGAYKNADDVKLAQLWCSVLEMKKDNLALQERVARIEDILNGMIERVKKQEEGKKKIVESLEKF